MNHKTYAFKRATAYQMARIYRLARTLKMCHAQMFSLMQPIGNEEMSFEDARKVIFDMMVYIAAPEIRKRDAVFCLPSLEQRQEIKSLLVSIGWNEHSLDIIARQIFLKPYKNCDSVEYGALIEALREFKHHETHHEIKFRR
jgi:hypothetical protein